jgi:sodium/proline symporter
MFFDNFTILAVVAVYFLFLGYLGVRGYKKTKTFSDYILGGRKLGPIVGAMNVGASDMSSWLLMGLPGAFYLYGMNQIWMIIGLVVGSYCSWKFVATRLRKYTEIANDSLTISSFLENRFRDKSGFLRTVTSIMIVFFFTLYISAGFVGSAKLFSSLFGLDYGEALLISVFVIIFYALIGGFLAVSWADLLQGTLMLFALLIVPIGMAYVMGGLGPINEVIQSYSPAHLDPFHKITFFGLLSTFAWGLGYFGQPHIISKYMAIKNSEEISTARKICISWMSLSMIGAAAVGLFGYAFLIETPLTSHETVFIVTSNAIFPAIIMGFILSAVLAAIMSTINGQIIICCGSLTEDFYKKFFRKNAENKELIIVTRIAVAIIAFLAYAIARDESSTVLKIVSHAWAGLGAAIGPIILCSLFWKRTTKYGAIFGILSGGISSIIYSKIPFFPYELLPAFITSLLVIIIVSLLSKNEISSDVSSEFTQMNQ